MYLDKIVSVAMPAYNEEKSISRVVRGFLDNEYVDEVVVADNNSCDRTRERALKAGARVVGEDRRGYGYACRRALKEAKGDYIILVESDGTFSPADVAKLLAYSDNFDVVLGTRTSKELIWDGANMGVFLKWGNWFLGKMIEVLYNGPSLTDAGCTFRLMKKRALNKVSSKFEVGGSHFSPEMIILLIKNNVRMIEIPVNYRPRVGESKITGEGKWKAFLLGLTMIKLMLVHRVRS